MLTRMVSISQSRDPPASASQSVTFYYFLEGIHNRILLCLVKHIWKEIKENLRNGGEYISIQKFYRYFWISRYTSSTEKNLYKNFKKTIEPSQYLSFLKELKSTSEIYSQIINPKEDYFGVSPRGNDVQKADLKPFINSLTNLKSSLKIEQIQVLLIVLVEKYRTDSLRFRDMKSIVRFLEEFHFIYNGILTISTNTLENKYGSFARKIYKEKNQNEIRNTISELKKNFIELIQQNKTKFIDNFSEKKYSSKISREKNNLLGHYIIYKLEELLSEDKGISFNRDDATIEHIIPESANTPGNLQLNIGNLILLERNLNRQCSNSSFTDKYNIYENSSYCITKDFLAKYSEFDVNSIKERSKQMAVQMYEMITSSWDTNNNKTKNNKTKNNKTKNNKTKNNKTKNDKTKNDKTKNDKKETFWITAIRNANASGTIVPNGFIVFKGSTISTSVVPSMTKNLISLREKLINDKIIDENFKFTKNYTFTSPTSAASIIMGRKANGRTEWKNKEGKNISDIEKI